MQRFSDKTLSFLGRKKEFSISKMIFVIAICASLYSLIRYKYIDFFSISLRRLGLPFPEISILYAPLGLSFIIFSAISYLADIKNGKAKPGSLIDCALYLSFFPKIASGPIILWQDFAPQISSCKPNLDSFISGINRICIGFAKKLLLADMFGLYISQINSQFSLGLDRGSYFIAVILYMLQIYYDFSAYSDIAIGLCNIIGFKCKENFNFPYRSRSITEFWRRWHISLGAWFREYVYIPLGGNRRGLRRTLLNLGIVFLLTGIWHGARWAYILWGAVNGFFIIVERIIKDKPLYKKTPSVLKWLFTMCIVMLFWEMFRFSGIRETVSWILHMFIPSAETVPCTWRYFLDLRLITLMAIGILGATVLGSPKLQAFGQRLICTKTGYAVREFILLLLFVLSVISMVSSSYSPFIYFQY